MNAAVQAYLLRKHEEHIDSDSCIECGTAIVHPVCPQCLKSQFISWMDNYGPLGEREGMIFEVSRFVESHKEFEEHSGICVTCGFKGVYLCPLCFTEYLWTVLKEYRINEELLEEFLVMFNFDFEHAKYYLEGEQLGLT